MAALIFGPFELDPLAGELRRNGARVRLRPQPCALLGLLAERSGSFVSRAELYRHLWHDHTHVRFDQGLNSCVKQIRRALHDDHRAPVYLETLPRRGYRFLAPVTVLAPDDRPRPVGPVEPDWLVPLARALARELAILMRGETDLPKRPIQHVESSAPSGAPHPPLPPASLARTSRVPHHATPQLPPLRHVVRPPKSQ